ncbi:TRAP transporter small permease [Desulfospira joergensenii]|uniref:TRAP transporter small permease n=1 Tax=Desulfospira joergensenii TaxID=53329 RepID=UPI0003B53B82|nr:TRAP transporter small permease [Desulfospira joergensenii]
MQRLFDILDRMEKFTLVWTILGLAFIGFIQVITRYIFNYSFTWFEELGRYLGVFIAFAGAATGVKTGSHFTMDLMVSNLSQPWQKIIKVFTACLSAVFFLVVAWVSWKIVLRMYGFETTSPTMQIPMYIAYLPIPAFSTLMGARFLNLGLTHLRTKSPGEAAP